MASNRTAETTPEEQRYYASRYRKDPVFRQRELERSKANIQKKYSGYQELWRQAYQRKKQRCLNNKPTAGCQDVLAVCSTVVSACSS